MIKRIYAIFDKVAEQMFGPMVVLPNDGAARRVFQDALFGEGSTMAPHPGDYALYHIGTINLETGVITPAATDKPFAGVPLITGDVLVDLATRKPEITNEG